MTTSAPAAATLDPRVRMQIFLASAPAAARPQLEPFVGQIVAAIHAAFSLATASTFTFGIAAALVTFVTIAFLREAPAAARVAAYDTAPAVRAEVADPAS